jgi:hypothetical protein
MNTPPAQSKPLGATSNLHSLTQEQRQKVEQALEAANKAQWARFDDLYKDHSPECLRNKHVFNGVCRVRLNQAIMDCYYRRDLLRSKDTKVVELIQKLGIPECVKRYKKIQRKRFTRICKAEAEVSTQCGKRLKLPLSTQGSESARLLPPPEPDRHGLPTEEEMTSLLRDSLNYFKQDFSDYIDSKKENIQARQSTVKSDTKLYELCEKLKADLQEKVQSMEVQFTKYDEHCYVRDVKPSRFLGLRLVNFNPALFFYEAWRDKVCKLKKTCIEWKEGIDRSPYYKQALSTKD